MVLGWVNNLPHDEKSSAIMERYQIILAYDGSQYKGFQRQANASSIQGVVEAALRKLNWQGKTILAAGRTDAGVHAMGQVIAFDLDWRHGSCELRSALNAHLPPDVVAREVRQVRQTFHPRQDASWRKYSYRIYSQPVRNPLLESYAWRIWPHVELDLLNESAKFLVGTYDFRAFGTPPQAGGNTIREVMGADWDEIPPFHIFTIAAQAFLYHMVRRIVFVQVSIAQRKLPLSYIQRSLESAGDMRFEAETERNNLRSLSHGLAPARGLILEEVFYPPDAIQMAEDNNIK
jgi:tRNA pseudouridine38-40 synthase